MCASVVRAGACVIAARLGNCWIGQVSIGARILGAAIANTRAGKHSLALIRNCLAVIRADSSRVVRTAAAARGAVAITQQ